jgi:UDP-N-acetylmuramate dehydrogenase
MKNEIFMLFKREYLSLNYKTKQYNFIIKFILFVFLLSSFYCETIKSKKNSSDRIDEIDKINLISSQSNLNSFEMKKEFIANLKSILKTDEIIENEMLEKHTTFRIGGPARFFTKPKTIEQIKEIIQLCNKYKVYYFILGNGSNLLVSDTGFNGVVIQIHEHNFSKLEVNKENDETYVLNVGAGMLMKTLAIEACLLSLTGLEDIIDIPGTVGAGIIMNASFIKLGLNIPLESVKVITPEGKMLELSKAECELRFRDSMLKRKKYLVFEATFKLKKGDQMKIQKTLTENTRMRYKNQPMYFGSAGCFFAWERRKYGSLYEKYKENNLVGYKVGNIMIYTFNISFIVNLGKGAAEDVMEIVNKIERTIKEKYNIIIRREVVVIGTIKGINYYF